MKNPILWGILLGLPFAALGITFPRAIMASLESVGGVGDAPCAAGNWGQLSDRCCKKLPETRFDSDISQAGRAGGGVPAPFAIWLGFREQQLVAILVMFASPTAAASYIMSVNLDNDGELSSSIIVYTTLFSAVTITAWIFLLRSLALI